MSNMAEKITAGAALVVILGSLLSLYVNQTNEMSSAKNDISRLYTSVNKLKGVNEEIVLLRERVDSMIRTNKDSIVVLSRLADSVEKLSVSVARLDERTKALEKEGP